MSCMDLACSVQLTVPIRQRNAPVASAIILHAVRPCRQARPRPLLPGTKAIWGLFYRSALTADLRPDWRSLGLTDVLRMLRFFPINSPTYTLPHTPAHMQHYGYYNITPY